MYKRQLHLEVPCFAVRPAGAPATCQVTEHSLPTGSDADHTQVSADQRLSVLVPVAVPANGASTVADSDIEQEVVNGSVCGELATVLSRAAALMETQQNADQNLTNGTGPVDSSSVNGVSCELPLSRHSSSSAVPDVLISANRKKSVVSRGRIRNGRVALARDRGRSLPLSAAQPSPISLASTTADLHK